LSLFLNKIHSTLKNAQNLGGGYERRFVTVFLKVMLLLQYIIFLKTPTPEILLQFLILLLHRNNLIYMRTVLYIQFDLWDGDTVFMATAASAHCVRAQTGPLGGIRICLMFLLANRVGIHRQKLFFGIWKIICRFQRLFSACGCPFFVCYS
jgi:hypothetical protein